MLRFLLYTLCRCTVLDTGSVIGNADITNRQGKYEGSSAVNSQELEKIPWSFIVTVHVRAVRKRHVPSDGTLRLYLKMERKTLTFYKLLDKNHRKIAYIFVLFGLHNKRNFFEAYGKEIDSILNLQTYRIVYHRLQNQ